MNLADVLMAHRIERCSVSNPEAAYQWGRCTGCDFESEYVPLKGVNWDELQRDIYAAHIVEAVAAAGLATVELPESGWRKESTEDENGAVSWEYPDGEVVVYDDGFFEWRAFGINDTDASRLRDAAAALLAAANAAEQVTS